MPELSIDIKIKFPELLLIFSGGGGQKVSLIVVDHLSKLNPQLWSVFLKSNLHTLCVSFGWGVKEAKFFTNISIDQQRLILLSPFVQNVSIIEFYL